MPFFRNYRTYQPYQLLQKIPNSRRNWYLVQVSTYCSKADLNSLVFSQKERLSEISWPLKSDGKRVSSPVSPLFTEEPRPNLHFTGTIWYLPPHLRLTWTAIPNLDNNNMCNVNHGENDECPSPVNKFTLYKPKHVPRASSSSHEVMFGNDLLSPPACVLRGSTRHGSRACGEGTRTQRHLAD
jgi:hypothetical protein